MADSTYAGVLAEKLPAVARQRMAQGLTKHHLLALYLAANGFGGLPTGYLDVYKNSRFGITAETQLRANRMPGAGQGEGFQYRILMDGSDSYYEPPVSFDDVTNFNAEDDSNRLQFTMKNIRTQPMVLARDQAEMKDGRLGNTDGFAGQVGQKMIKFLNGLARQLILGDGAGDNLNGLADHIKGGSGIRNGFGLTAAGWSSETIGALDQNANASLRNHAYDTATSDATSTAAKATAFLAKIDLAIAYATRGGPNGVFGVLALLTRSRLATVLTMANQQLLASGEQWGNVQSAQVKVLLGRHIFVEGVPYMVDSFVPANYIYTSNLETLGLDWKGATPFKSTGVIDLAEIGAGYPIGSKGMQVEFQGNQCNVLPEAGSVISSFSG